MRREPIEQSPIVIVVVSTPLVRGQRRLEAAIDRRRSCKQTRGQERRSHAARRSLLWAANAVDQSANCRAHLHTDNDDNDDNDDDDDLR